MRTHSRFAALLLAYHEASGKSWRELARRCGLTSGYLHDVAKGRRNVRPARARAYAIALGADPEAWVQAALRDELDRT